MATNVYFSQKLRSEQHLYEDIIIESLKMYGQDVYYLPREVIYEDTILNEDVESQFDSAYTIEMYIENQDGFEGDGDVLAKFGVEIRDQATFIVSKRRWEQLVGIKNNGINSTRPNEGDLIYLPLSKSLFEVRFVEHEQPFYQLSNLPVYKIQCELFEMSGETINTGITEVDNVNKDHNVDLVIQLDPTTNNGILFENGETITQIIDTAASTPEYITAMVVEFNPSTFVLQLTDWATTDGKYHEFRVSTVEPDDHIVGLNSGASYYVNHVYTIADDLDKRTFVSDTQADNQEFERAAEDIIDFSENNPFGDLG